MERNPTPPHSLEIEQAVLCLLIRDAQKGDIFDDIALIEEDFYYPYNKQLFKAISDLQRMGQPVDYATLCDKLASVDEVATFEYELYVRGIIDEVVSDNLVSYVAILKNHAAMRMLLTHIKEIETDIYAQTASQEDIINKAEKAIFHISSKVQTQDHLRHIQTVNQSAKSQIEDKAKRGDDVEYETGYTDLDKMTNGLHPGELVIIAGRPSMGKTSFAVNIAEHLATIKNKGVVIFSMEMSAESLAIRLFSAVGSIPMQHLRDGKLKAEEWVKLTSAMSELDKTDIVIDNTADMSPVEIRTRARKAARMMKNPLGLVVVDYIQLMRGNANRDGNRVLEISDISRALKNLAVELQVPVIALSQLNRAVENRPNKRPLMSDLRESGAIEQDADLILFIYRDEVYNKSTEDKGVAEVHIAKHRNGETGMIKLKFFGQYTRFDNLAQHSGFTPPPIATPFDDEDDSFH